MLFKLLSTSPSLFTGKCTVQSSVPFSFTLSVAFDTIDHPSLEILSSTVFQDTIVLVLLFSLWLLLFRFMISLLSSLLTIRVSLASGNPFSTNSNSPDDYLHSTNSSDKKKHCIIFDPSHSLTSKSNPSATPVSTFFKIYSEPISDLLHYPIAQATITWINVLALWFPSFHSSPIQAVHAASRVILLKYELNHIL